MKFSSLKVSNRFVTASPFPSEFVTVMIAVCTAFGSRFVYCTCLAVSLPVITSRDVTSTPFRFSLMLPAGNVAPAPVVS